MNHLKHFLIILLTSIFLISIINAGSNQSINQEFKICSKNCISEFKSNINNCKLIENKTQRLECAKNSRVIYKECRANCKIIRQECIQIYKPVCGEKEVQCIKAPCNPVNKTYGNKCLLEADKAKFLYEGECKKAHNNVTTR